MWRACLALQLVDPVEYVSLVIPSASDFEANSSVNARADAGKRLLYVLLQLH